MIAAALLAVAIANPVDAPADGAPYVMDDIATWSVLLATVRNDSDVAFYDDTLHVKLEKTGESLDPATDSFINYKYETQLDGVSLIRQWGVHGPRVFFSAYLWQVDGKGRSGQPCLKLKDFRTAAGQAGWSQFSTTVSGDAHGFRMEKDNIAVKVEADGGAGLHGQFGYNPDWDRLEDCAARFYVMTVT